MVECWYLLKFQFHYISVTPPQVVCGMFRCGSGNYLAMMSLIQCSVQQEMCQHEVVLSSIVSKAFKEFFGISHRSLLNVG